MKDIRSKSQAGFAPSSAASGMRFAYADPPYLGVAEKHYGHLHSLAADYDRPEAWQALIDRLGTYDGWAMSLSSPSLRTILPMCPPKVRVMAWVKPFASFKPGVGVAYAWEPIIVMGGRRRTRQQDTVRDWVAENITLRRGFTGAKPAAVTFWLISVLNAQPGDEIEDLFPGSGAVTQAINAWKMAQTGECDGEMFTRQIQAPATRGEATTSNSSLSEEMGEGLKLKLSDFLGSD